MDDCYQTDWEEVGRMLKEALERYRDEKRYETLERVYDDLSYYLPGRKPGEGLSYKMIYRHTKGLKIPPRRLELFVEWFHNYAKRSRAWLTEWLKYTDYPHPGELLARVCDAGGDLKELYDSVKRDGLPDYRRLVWEGDFLERDKEIGLAQEWANGKRVPIAMLGGFGGNGKTTIQLKIGDEFLYGRKCSLCWPFEGVVWVSASDYSMGLPNLLEILRKVVETFEPPEDSMVLRSARPDWLIQRAKNILMKRRVLILLDNFETILTENQDEILAFFGLLRGESQMLISSRHRPNSIDMTYMFMLIRVDGLRPEQSKVLIQNFLKAHQVSLTDFASEDLDRLIEITQNNPKAINVVLGLVLGGHMSLPSLLDSIIAGSPEADEVFYTIFHKAWQEDVLTEIEKAVLMAKSFFSQPTNVSDLGQIAGVETDEATRAIRKLRDMSFFEWSKPNDLLVRTHPLAQDFSRRILRDHSDFERKAEERWWSKYAPHVVQQARQTSYTELLGNRELERDVTNVLERLEHHLKKEDSPYISQAAELFAGRKGLGHALRAWGRWDDLLRLGEITLDFAISQQNPDLVGRCALQLINFVYRERNEIGIANKILAQVVEFNADLQDQWLQATIEIERAHIFRRDELFKAAKQYYENALKLYLEFGEKSDIADVYSSLGGDTVDIAITNLDGATIDPQEPANEELLKAEDYFSKSDHYWNQVEKTEPMKRFSLVAIQAWRAVIARARGNLDEARELFIGCMGRFQSLVSIARLYRELALVEYLEGNKGLARDYEERGVSLQRQLGISKRLHNHNCYKVIDRLKEEGKW